MFDFEYRPDNGGFMSYAAYLAAKKAENCQDEELDNLSEIVAEQAGTVAENSAAIASNASAIKNEAYAREEADAQETSMREAADEELHERINNIPQSDIDLSNYIEREEFDDAIGSKADMTDVYSRAEADSLFLTGHQDISNLASKDELASAVASLASQESVNEIISQEASERSEKDAEAFEAINSVVSGLADEISAREEAVVRLYEEIAAIPRLKFAIVPVLPASGERATLYYVPTSDEKENKYTEYAFIDGSWEKLGAREIDLSGYAKIETVEALSGIVEDLTFETESTNEKLIGLAEVNEIQDAEINSLSSNLSKLKEIVGDLGGNVEYAVPGDGKLTDVLKKSGTVKLMEDTESATYTGGLTSKNVTTLNTNGKTLTFTGNTVNNPGIMTRGAEQLTIVGKGTIDAAGRIAVEANGANSVINLSGSTGFFGAEPTYVTDRSGGELIYCYLGTINIYAGIFMNNGENKGFTLNCYDANYKSGKANIIVMGGKFYDFDPANNAAEGEATSFVPDGYESVHTTEEIEGVVHDVYTVKKTA